MKKQATAERLRALDLRRWNLLQINFMRYFEIPIDPDHVAAFGRWFDEQVNHLGRFPRVEEYSPLSIESKKPDNR